MNYSQGDILRDIALDRVGDASRSWQEKAFPILASLCRKVEWFTTDDLWKSLEEAGVEDPKEPRAMGALMRNGFLAGICTPMDQTLKSSRPACHSRPLRIWRSIRG